MKLHPVKIKNLEGISFNKLPQANQLVQRQNHIMNSGYALFWKLILKCIISNHFYNSTVLFAVCIDMWIDNPK